MFIRILHMPKLVTLVLCLIVVIACTPSRADLSVDQTKQADGVWTTWTTDDGLPENEVRSLFEDSSRRMWFGTRNKGIASYSGTLWEYYSSEDGLISNGILSIVEDREGVLWVAGGGGISFYTDDEWIAQDSLGSLNPRVVYSVKLDHDGDLWFGANGGASRLADGEWQHFNQQDGLPHQVVHVATNDRETGSWFACRQGLAQLSDGKLTVHYPEDNFGSIVSIGPGNIWFGTRTSGALHFDGQTWTQHLITPDLRPVIIDRNGNVWAVSDDAGVFYYDGATWHNFTTTDGLASNTVFDIVESYDGSLWFATNEGVSKYDL